MIGDVAQLIGALVLAFNCWQSYMNGRRGKANAVKLIELNDNVQTVEKATNSMKDALVASTAKASLAEGRALGRKEARDEYQGPFESVDVNVTNVKEITDSVKKEMKE